MGYVTSISIVFAQLDFYFIPLHTRKRTLTHFSASGTGRTPEAHTEQNGDVNWIDNNFVLRLNCAWKDKWEKVVCADDTETAKLNEKKIKWKKVSESDYVTPRRYSIALRV